MNELLRTPVDHLKQWTVRLDTLLDASRVQDVQATKASRQLQERLRLSARMLRAFQTQIDRVESKLKSQQEHERQLRQLDAEIELKFVAVQSRLDTMLRQFIGTLDESSQAAIMIHGQRSQESGGQHSPVADDARGRATNDMTWLITTMRDVALRMEQLAALASHAAPVANERPDQNKKLTADAVANAPLSFQRYASKVQG